MPIEHRIDFLFQSHKASGTGTGGWVDQLIKCYDSSNSDSRSARQDLEKACRLIIEYANEILAANSRKSDSVSKDGRKSDSVSEDGRTSDSVSEDGRKLDSFSTDRLLEKIVLGGLRMNDQSLCCEALSAVIEAFPQPTTVKVIERFGFAQIKSM
jgi:hypothetical protein